MRIRWIPTHIITSFIASLFLAGLFMGCIGGTSPKSSYYLLTASQTGFPSQDAAPAIDIGVGPVKLPGFLTRPEIVTRQGKNHLIVNEFHRWGDSLESQINQVLAENLSSRLDGANVVIYPWERPLAPKYQIYVNFRRFDGTTGESVTLEAIWWVVKTADDKRMITKRSSITIPTRSDTFEAYVATQNTALEKLSLEIAEALIDSSRSQNLP